MIKLDKVLYRDSATSTGGRAGTVSSSDQALALQLTRPVELGARHLVDVPLEGRDLFAARRLPDISIFPDRRREHLAVG